MKNFIVTAFLSAALLTGGSLFGAQISVRIGPPPAPRVERVLPRSPGAGYVWVDGYWYPSGKHWKWHKGYWTRAPYPTARWIAPRYDGNQFFNGYWEGDRGRIEHDHHWDHSRERDYRGRERDHERHG